MHNFQFLDQNFATVTGTTVNASQPRISTMYGGQPGDPSSSSPSSGALASISTFYRDGSVYSGSAQQFTISFSAPRAPSNFIIKLAFSVTGSHEVVIFDAGISGLNAAKRIYAWPVNENMYYAYVPEPTPSNIWTVVFIGVGSQTLMLDDLFIGDAVAVNSPVATGLSHTTVDPSIITYADSGRAYAVKKTQYQTISSLRLPYLNRHQVTAFKSFSEVKGLTDPFWISMDPMNDWDGPSFGMSFGAYTFSSIPTFTHDFLDKFTASFSLREAL